MNKRNALVIVAILMATAIGAYFFFAPSPRGALPVLPDLSSKPARLTDELRRAHRAALRNADDPDAVGHLGQMLHANLLHAEAAQCYRRALELDPGNGRWCYYLAVLIQSTGFSDELASLLSQVPGAEPGFLPARLRLADTHRALGNLEVAEAAYRICVADDSFAPFAYLGLARIAMSRGDMVAAEAALTASLNKLSDHGPAVDLLAVVQSRLGKDEDAAAARNRAESARRGLEPPDPWLDQIYGLCLDPDYLMILADGAVQIQEGIRASHFYQLAIEVAPEDPHPRVEFAKAMITQEQSAKAVPLLKGALALDPSNGEAFVQLAAAFMKQGDLRRATDAARRAVELEPRSAASHNILGAILTVQGHIHEAAESLNAALRLDPDHTAALVTMGNILSQAGQPDDAVVHYLRALSIQPRNDLALVGMGALHFRQNRLDEAEEYYARALRVVPELAGAHYDLGVIHASRGNIDLAIEKYREAIRINPDHYPALVNLGAELAELGHLNEAIARFRRALVVRPGSADLHNNLGFAYAANDQPELAAEHYAKALEIDPEHAQASQNLNELEW
jgi:tetratricopeptide (TPR) repeat protein